MSRKKLGNCRFIDLFHSPNLSMADARDGKKSIYSPGYNQDASSGSVDPNRTDGIFRNCCGTCERSIVEAEVEVKLRPTVSRPVRLVVRHPSWSRHQFFFLLDIFFSQLRVCYFVARSLTIGLFCNLLLLVVLASAVPLGPESRGTQNRILLSQSLRLLQPGRPGPRIYIPQEQGGPDIPRALGSLSVASYHSQGYGWGILSHLHTG
jgi:hypothetical protein